MDGIAQLFSLEKSIHSSNHLICPNSKFNSKGEICTCSIHFTSIICNPLRARGIQYLESGLASGINSCPQLHHMTLPRRDSSFDFGLKNHISTQVSLVKYLPSSLIDTNKNVDKLLNFNW